MLIEFALSLIVTFTPARNSRGLQWEENYEWLPGIGVRYHLGTDGLSTLFVLLVGITGVIALVASWESIRTNIKAYYVSYLLLMTGMIGVFHLVRSRVVLRLLGTGADPDGPHHWRLGKSANRVYSAVKFFLFTLAGSLLMLVGIVALYTAVLQRNRRTRTTDLILLGAA